MQVKDNPWLSPPQRVFLSQFFALQIGQSFFLTGGTALAAFYLHHRLSLDLDLFTLDDLALAEAARLVPVLAGKLAFELEHARHTEHFHRFLLEDAAGETLRVDLVQDFGPQFGEHRQVEGVIVDSLENIAANKMTAVLSRTEPKDFVDLYFILQAGYTFEALLEMGQQKDTGLVPFYLAGALTQVRRLSLLPDTSPPVSRDTLEAYFVDLADQLVDRSRPPG